MLPDLNTLEMVPEILVMVPLLENDKVPVTLLPLSKEVANVEADEVNRNPTPETAEMLSILLEFKV